MAKQYLIISTLLLISMQLFAQVFKPGEVWLDTDGAPINAHGGGILYHEGTYYWYGTHMHENTSAALKGVGVYSSKDLYQWKNEGIALHVKPDCSGHKIENGCLIERPKVIYNPKNRNFVMWFHLELKGQGYKAAEYGVAISDSPVGPFKYQHAGRANSGIFPFDMKQEEIAHLIDTDKANWKSEDFEQGAYLIRDLGTGQMVRDMTLFVDDDQKAYHVFASEDNQTLHIAELTDDYSSYSGKYTRVLPRRFNEAPTIFKKEGVYWMITSDCTGWTPNPARLSKATNIWGPWVEFPNPCRGNKTETTFDSQGTFILPVQNKKDTWIFMADRWNSENLKDSRYVWLPIQFEQGQPILQWQDTWKIK